MSDYFHMDSTLESDDTVDDADDDALDDPELLVPGRALVPSALDDLLPGKIEEVESTKTGS